MLLGVASGDRPTEYPAFGVDHDYASRGERFREALSMFRSATEEDFPSGSFSRYGRLDGSIDTVPKPRIGRLPVLVTGRSQQDLDWIATNSDGWFYYHVGLPHIQQLATSWRAAVERAHGDGAFLPLIQGLFLDLDEDANAPLRPIHAGLRLGRNALIDFLSQLQAAGVQHAAFNTKPSQRPVIEVMQELAEFVLPHFSSHAGPLEARDQEETISTY